mmetsp:Transcript_41275/g.128959  ORF Transcript_41275/g.128959 Transcript_41275/m.128959 type:complete len:291 (-) Transcript_41275:487-1359(-)
MQSAANTACSPSMAMVQIFHSRCRACFPGLQKSSNASRRSCSGLSVGSAPGATAAASDASAGMAGTSSARGSFEAHCSTSATSAPTLPGVRSSGPRSSLLGSLPMASFDEWDSPDMPMNSPVRWSYTEKWLRNHGQSSRASTSSGSWYFPVLTRTFIGCQSAVLRCHCTFATCASLQGICKCRPPKTTKVPRLGKSNTGRCRCRLFCGVSTSAQWAPPSRESQQSQRSGISPQPPPTSTSLSGSPGQTAKPLPTLRPKGASEQVQRKVFPRSSETHTSPMGMEGPRPPTT